MMHLKKLLTTQLVVPNKVVIFALIIAVLGFADASYLTIEHYQGVIPPCTTGGCEKVLTSEYSTMFGIPDSLVGAIYYFLVAVGLFAFLDTKKQWLLKVALSLPVIGFLFSLWFVYLQAFVLHSYCQYCLLSALTSTILFVISVVTFRNSTAPACAGRTRYIQN